MRFRTIALTALTVLAVVVVSLLTWASTASAQGELEARADDGSPVHVTLVDERVRATIDKQHARTTLRQVFVSRADRRVEGRYRIQTDKGTRVRGFAYWNGKKKIVGEVFEKNTARDVYEEVSGQRRDPGLLEKTGEGAFTFRVFPIEPGQRKPVEVEMARWLPRRGRDVTYRVPLSQPGADVEVELHDDRPLGRIRSPTHHLDIQRTADDRWVIRTTAPKGTADELVLRWSLRDRRWHMDAAVHRDAGHAGYMMLSLGVPEEVGADRVSAKDVTLVVDRSGSMDGVAITQARAAAARLVRRLGPRDRLNVIAFDDATDALFPAPRAAAGKQSEVRSQALSFIERLRSGGGTDLAGALERSLQAQHGDDRPHVVLFVTDGQSDAQAALDVAQKNAGDARVYTVGVGHGVEKPLLSKLARIRRGRFAFIPSRSALESRMARLYQRLANPVMVDLSMQVKGARLVERYPRKLPDLYEGDELRIAARVLGTGASKVVLKGRVGGERKTITRRVDVPKTNRRPWVGRLWAQSRVDDLLERIALHGESDERKNEVLELALAYNFVTPYTSFLAIPESEITDAVRDTIESARERKKRILAQNPDAAALSRSKMPPGDPVIEVRAPADARRVTAYFPFGLELDLRYDRHTERWRNRFLVPRSVSDGSYNVRVVVVRADGRVQAHTVTYTIDSAEPGFDVDTTVGPDGVQLTVTTDEKARQVTVARVSDPTVRATLEDTGDGRTFEGRLQLPPGTHEVRVVVADQARNESDRVVSVEIGR